VLVAPAGLPAHGHLVAHLLPLAIAAARARPRFLPLLVADAARAGPRTLWRAARDLVAEDATAEVAAIRAQTLLVWGERDALVPPAVGAAWERELPSGRLVVLPRAGHVPMFERPADFDRAVVGFLSGDGGILSP
jgi:pimeloyl-ACP methyl ester carboxylesterase